MVRRLGAPKTSTGVGVPCFLEGWEIQTNGTEAEGLGGWQRAHGSRRRQSTRGTPGLGDRGDLGGESRFSLLHWTDD